MSDVMPRLGARASASLSDGEVEALDRLFGVMLRNGDTRPLSRDPDLANVARKVATMKTALGRQRARRAEALAARRGGGR